jgi:dTDP-4-amino-4,6-dideoxy-D-galactose acyltransferase
MALEVQNRDWDSLFFGIKIGQVFYTGDFKELSDILRENKEFKLIYLFSEKSIPEFDNYLVDIKVVFNKKTERIDSKFDDIEVVTSEIPQFYNDLLDLALLSGKYSRFKTDKNLPKGSYERLYKTWLDKTLNKTFGKIIFISRQASEIAGFITLNNLDSTTCEIGLIAVSEKHQGLGIGRKLIQYTTNYAINEGYSNIKVATQGVNLAAIKLYEKSGFKKNIETYIYHIWK